MHGNKLKLNSKHFKITSEDGILLFFLISYLIGYIVGVLLIKSQKSAIYSFSENLFNSSLDIVMSKGFVTVFIYLFVFFLILSFLIYLSGMNVFGCGIIPAVMLIYGSFCGIIVSYIYLKFSVSGMGYSALTVIPVLVISTFIILLSSREAFCFSEFLLKSVFPDSPMHSLSKSFKLYSFRFLVILLFFILSSLLGALIITTFTQYFDF